MKLSLSWLCDHIDADWKKIDIQKLVNLFNKTTAEIENFNKIFLDLKKLAAAKIKEINNRAIVVEVSEWNHTIDMPLRPDTEVDQVYLIAKEGNNYEWARLSHFASEKEGMLPAFNLKEKDLKGEWKKHIESEDIIIHLDNKSVNHRPDMWGHRGVAREVAAMLNLPFKAIDHMISAHKSEQTKNGKSIQSKDFSISVETPACKRFAGLYVSKIDASASDIKMAARLAKIDSRPINFIVDATNYVMFDIGQPMHAFDVNKLNDATIEVRNAKNKETITLLDGQSVALSGDDCVITDGKKPVALAGIMGGKDTGIDAKSPTLQIFLESANFDPVAIRKTAARIKKRSEASARFEKSLDPNQIILAIQRFLKLAEDGGISYVAADPIMVAGDQAPQKTIEVDHTYIEQLLGARLDPKFVITTLERLEFAVIPNKEMYQIGVPSFRATKDIANKQDIVEEIGRFYGYDHVAEVLPSRQTNPFDLNPVMRKRKIKQLLAYALNMHEVYTYAFFDESFLQTINWEPKKTLQVQEAVSENWQRLVTTLIPNLFKVVHAHSSELDQMNFFDWARIWPQEKELEEKSSLAGIFVNQKGSVDFYECKQRLCNIATLLGVYFDWIKVDESKLAPWYLPYETAYLMCDGMLIGTAGKVSPTFFNKVAAGDAFIFELDADFLLNHSIPIKQYIPAYKYPSIVRDVSMLIPLSATVQSLRDALKKIDTKITQVDLIDFFEKPEWKDQKSLTFRITIVDPNATMTTAQADSIMSSVNAYLQKQGAMIR
jgi:phenylalanyl-tRNA synthetase beta chain